MILSAGATENQLSKIRFKIRLLAENMPSLIICLSSRKDVQGLGEFTLIYIDIPQTE